MMNPNAIRNIIGIIGNVISFGLFLSPVPTFWRIIKNKSVEQFKPDPYVATILNCAMWILYGLPFVHPNNILVATINGIGLFIELVYVIIFLIYSDGLKRRKITIALFIEAIFFVVVLLITRYVFHSTDHRTIFVGVLCVIFNIMMYFSPLTVMRQVIKSKSVKYMPFWLSVTNFLNGACWTAYACIHIDVWMVIPNGLGTISGVIQLILYACFYKSTQWTDQPDTKVSQVQLEP
ncbi:bidirectional sugar transporter SWEET5 [Beta vulgaris subsp. vulgaris]|uniref:bidirectional sugar transporter SWEET5 n=1 Tax=Beta vulgaris subsp. vulgaris TaxID=3555 RepID=UPI002036CF24|nr:bidirectional sugar transporter SWEET5 [Beta vulgaris subsp. vulgaris]